MIVAYIFYINDSVYTTSSTGAVVFTNVTY